MFVSQNFVNSSLKSTFCYSIYSKVNPCFSIFILVRLGIQGRLRPYITKIRRMKTLFPH